MLLPFSPVLKTNRAISWILVCLYVSTDQQTEMKALGIESMEGLDSLFNSISSEKPLTYYGNFLYFLPSSTGGREPVKRAGRKVMEISSDILSKGSGQPPREANRLSHLKLEGLAENY